MFKYAIVVLFAVIVGAAAKPGALFGAPLAYHAPLVTATSNQVIARTFNGIAAAPLPVARFVAGPAAVAPVAKLVAAAPAAYASPVFPRYAAGPVIGQRYAAYAAAPYAAAYASPYGYAAPLTYAPSFAAALRYSVL